MALAKWALAEGCPREKVVGVFNTFTMAAYAAGYGHLELVLMLIKEQGFAMDTMVMDYAAGSGNLELVQGLRGEGCHWDYMTCKNAIQGGHVEVLRWARENGCPWVIGTKSQARRILGYTDELGNLVDFNGYPVPSDEDDSDEDSGIISI